MSHIDDNVLNEYLDEQLDAAMYGQVNAHLVVCEGCRGRLAEMEQFFTALVGLPEVPLRVDLSRQVVERISAEFKPRPIPRWTIAIVALQMMAALALFIWLWPSMQPFIETTGEILPQTAGQLLPNFSLSGMVDPLFDGLERLSEFGETLGPASPLPILEGFIIIGLALVFWLAGSGLLLRQSLTMRPKS